MRKTVVTSLFALFVLSACPAFAQFKMPLKNTINHLRLVRAVERAKQGVYMLGGQIRPVPAGLIQGNRVALTAATVSVGVGVEHPVLNHLASYRREALKHISPYAPLPKKLDTQIVNRWVEINGQAFYNSQTALARDLDTFFEGKGAVRVGPDGHTVKIYPLPVDGILYKPGGYASPLVLSAQEYFVVYNPSTQTGQIAQNNPEIYQWFKRVDITGEEIWKALGMGKKFDDLNNLCYVVLMTHLHKARLEKLQSREEEVDVYATVQENRALVYKQMNTSRGLAPYLSQFSQVRLVENGTKAYVVPLPVEGLSWVEHDGTAHFYNPQEHVMILFETGAVGVFSWVDVENPDLFTKLK